MEELIQKIRNLKSIIYKLTREKELSNIEREIIDEIIEEKDYGEENSGCY